MECWWLSPISGNSNKVAIARAIEEEMGDRRRFNADGGPRVDESIPNNCSESKGQESAHIAAEKAGFGSHMTYRRAIARALEEEMAGRRGSNQHKKKELPDNCPDAEPAKERQGRRTDLKHDFVDNCPQSETGQKSREIVAQKVGFGSDMTYRRAIARAIEEELAGRRGSNQYKTKELPNNCSEAEPGKERQGRRTDLKPDIPDNCPESELGQKSREKAAKAAGFSSETTYRRAIARAIEEELKVKAAERQIALAGTRKGDIPDLRNNCYEGEPGKRSDEIAAEKAIERNSSRLGRIDGPLG